MATCHQSKGDAASGLCWPKTRGCACSRSVNGHCTNTVRVQQSAPLCSWTFEHKAEESDGRTLLQLQKALAHLKFIGTGTAKDLSLPTAKPCPRPRSLSRRDGATTNTSIFSWFIYSYKRAALSRTLWTSLLPQTAVAGRWASTKALFPSPLFVFFYSSHATHLAIHQIL